MTREARTRGAGRRVVFYVQHLLGIGHVFRALRIARQLADDGWAVTLVLGGAPIVGLDTCGLELVQLPPVKAGSDGFSDLVQLNGSPADHAFKNARRDLLLAAFERARPDILLIEAFPFGRRQMRFELLPLLQAARAATRKPRIACSVRDILQENRKPERDAETLETLARSFDAVIVHGDPAFAPLDETFRRASEIACPISYSGYVAPRLGDAPVGPAFDVLVSAGGGAVGRALLTAAVAAKPLTSLSGARWLCVTGTNMPPAEAAELRRRAADADIEVAEFIPNLVDELARARLSISQAGYNTVADVLVASCAAVYVPFAAGGETEQTRRAMRLERLGVAAVVSETDLEARRLATAIDKALGLARQPSPIALDGADQTSRLLDALAARRGD